jgi:hypothetical protein
MNNHLRGMGAVVTAFGLSGLLACSSSSSDAQSRGDAGGADEAAAPGDDAGAGDGSAATDAGSTDESAQQDGGGGDAGADGQRGVIYLSQAVLHTQTTGDTADYALSVNFVTTAELARERAAATVTTAGDCTATIVAVDPDAGPARRVSGLNAGSITATGNRMPGSITVDYGPNGDAGPANYTDERGNTKFYEDGDVITIQGVGGPDLPAFHAVSLVAPSEIALTAPTCTGSCPSIDRTMDMLVTWENGGAGKVLVTIETVADTEVALVQCKFETSVGMGTVPSSLLGMLGDTTDPSVAGVMQIDPINEVTFPVGNVSTTFTIEAVQFESVLGG